MTQKIQSYEIIERIGIGGMGIVYKAKHSFRNEIVAIKSLSPQFCHDDQLRQRFINEASILNKLNHPNIVKVLDFIEEKDELHLVMEYVSGKTLDKIIGKEIGPIHYEKALVLFNQMLEAVSYAHKKGIIHRDLKPSNIIVNEKNVIKVTDFGIAKVVSNFGFTKTGTKMGTIYYMSPEQIKGEQVDEQSDIYSLGITLYEMLAGRLPFDKSGDTSEFTLMNQIVNTQLPDPRDFYPSIPEWLVDIVKKAISKNKRDRIKSCKEFIELLIGEPNNLESIETQQSKEPEKSVEVSRLNEKENKIGTFIAGLIFITFIIVLVLVVKKAASVEVDDYYLNVKIGDQVWMIENLNVDHYRNGDPISEVKDSQEWANLKTGAWCYYNNEPYNDKYGKLYNWYAVNDQRGLAPEGWHIPDKKEFNNFIKVLDNSTRKLNGSNFVDLLPGHRYSYGEFGNIDYELLLWSSDWYNNALSNVLEITKSNENIKLVENFFNSGVSVRCIRD